MYKHNKQRKDTEETDMEVIEALVNKAKQEGDMAEVKRLQTIRLKKEPNNLRVINDLISIAKQEGDMQEERRLLQIKLTLQPDSIRVKNDLKRVEAKIEQDE